MNARIRSLSLSTAAALLCAPAAAQTAGDAPSVEPGDEYARLLRQISDTRTNIMRSEMLLGQQESRIGTLREEIETAPAKLEGYAPVLNRFVARLETVIDEDVPFLREERYDRFGRLQEIVGSDEAQLGEKVARALQVATIETNYGYEVESYDANHPTDPGRRYRACQEDVDSAACALTDELREDMEGGRSVPQMELDLTDGSYVRYGRLSLAYVDLGTDEMLVFDPTSGEFREARGSEEAGIRRNLRIARGESAPDVVEAPVVKTN